MQLNESQSNDNDGLLLHNEIKPEVSDRLNFIRKVYSIVATQLVITTLISSIPVANKDVAYWMVENYGLFIFAIVGYIATACTLICVRSISRKVPVNYILLGFFTLCVSYIVASCVGFTDPNIVIAAAATTAVVVCTLTAYAYYTKTDFTLCAPFMLVLGVGLIFCSLFALIFNF